MISMVEESDELQELRRWLAEDYERSVRTAYLILGSRQDAEDVVQEAYLRAWRFRDALAAKSSARPWLYRVVVNTCHSHQRREIPHERRREDLEALETLASTTDRAEELATSRDVMAAIAELPEHLRVVVVLRYYAGLSEREIAVAISRQPGTVKSRLSVARARLATSRALAGWAPERSKESAP